MGTNIVSLLLILLLILLFILLILLVLIETLHHAQFFTALVLAKHEQLCSHGTGNSAEVHSLCGWSLLGEKLMSWSCM